MDSIDYIKSRIEEMYKSKSIIHVDIKLKHPRVILKGSTAIVTGAYRNIFGIEIMDKGGTIRHTFQYGDVLIGHVVIEELDWAPTVCILDKK